MWFWSTSNKTAVQVPELVGVQLQKVVDVHFPKSVGVPLRVTKMCMCAASCNRTRCPSRKSCNSVPSNWMVQKTNHVPSELFFTEPHQDHMQAFLCFDLHCHVPHVCNHLIRDSKLEMRLHP